jgi:exonuclease VII small subunit
MTKKEDFSYEAAKKRLEKIQSDIDSGKIGIDELETALAEAKVLINKSLEKLAKAEEIIIKWDK